MLKKKHENVYGKRPAYNVLGSKAIQGHLPLQAFLNLNLHTFSFPFKAWLKVQPSYDNVGINLRKCLNFECLILQL